MTQTPPAHENVCVGEQMFGVGGYSFGRSWWLARRLGRRYRLVARMVRLRARLRARCLTGIARWFRRLPGCSLVSNGAEGQDAISHLTTRGCGSITRAPWPSPKLKCVPTRGVPPGQVCGNNPAPTVPPPYVSLHLLPDRLLSRLLFARSLGDGYTVLDGDLG